MPIRLESSEDMRRRLERKEESRRKEAERKNERYIVSECSFQMTPLTKQMLSVLQTFWESCGLKKQPLKQILETLVEEKYDYIHGSSRGTF